MSRKQIDEIKDFLCICADDKISLAQYKNLLPHHNPEMLVASKLPRRLLADT